MKKILTVALMLCIFTAMAVGTAAAKPATIKIDSMQMQNSQACGLYPKATSSQIAGVGTFNGCYTKVVVAGGAQTGCASAFAGTASVCNSQVICASICT